MLKVSIIVPCYNQAQYLDECLESVMLQTYSNWECIIVNDGSPDNTDQVVKKWLARDFRIKYIQIKNSGVSNARNVGIKNAGGFFILPLDADDKIGKNYLKKAVKAFQRNSSLKLVYCYAEKFGIEKGNLILPKFSLNKLANDNIIFCSALFKKQDWEFIGGYDLNMVHGLEDWEFWIALLKNNGEVLRLNYIGFYYRIKSSSRQTDLRFIEKKKLFEYINLKHNDFFSNQTDIKSSHTANRMDKCFTVLSNKIESIKIAIIKFF